MPFYNAREYLEPLIESLQAQTNQNFKAVFIDDCSVDDGPAYLQNHQNLNFEMILLKTPLRVGPLGSRVMGMKALQGEAGKDDILCFLDGDDYLYANTALEIIADAYQNPKCLMTHGSWISHYYGVLNNSLEKNCVQPSRANFDNMRRHPGNMLSHFRTVRYGVFLEMLKRDPELNCFRRSDNNKFYTFATDMAFSVCASELIDYENLFFIKDLIYYYRVTPHTTVGTHSEEERKQIIKMICSGTSLRNRLS